MGKAILLTNCDFSAHNIGQVTFTQDIPLISLGISGPDSVSGTTNVTTYAPVYNPANTNQRGVTWTITSGSEYATITTGGTLSILEGASGSAVTIKVTSTVDSSIYATKNITVTYDSSIETNTITVTATPTLLTATTTAAVASNITITFTGDLSTTLTINSGTTGNSKSITSGGSSRTCNLAVSPTGDASYNYVLSSSTIIIPAGVGTNIITVSATANSITATSSDVVTSAVTVTFTGDLSTTLTIASGSTTATGSVVTSTSSRTCNLTISPTGDASYNYVLSSNSVVIPASTISANIMIVGPESIEGDVRAGNYYILDTANMKQVVGSSNEVTDDYKEYLGTINWDVTSGTGYADLESASGTAGNLNVKSGANNNNVTLSATVGDYNATKTVSTKYRITDYIITSFADLQALETAINNGTESSITIPLASGSTYTPTTGFSGAHFRLGNDINCNNNHVEIGKYNASKNVNKYFSGIFDGAGYSIYNIGGECGATGSAAEGGYVGSILCGNLNAGTIRNLELYGAVTTAASRGFGGICAFAVGNCKLENIYNACDFQYTSANAATMQIMVGWDGSSSSTTTFNDCIYAGKAVNCRQIPGYTSTNASSMTRCSNIGKLTVEYGQATGHTSLAGVGDTANSPKANLNSCYQIMGMEGINKGTSSDAGDRMIGGKITDGYEATICTGQMKNGYCSMYSSNTRTYTQNSWGNGTAKTASEIKNSITFGTENNWINTSGYYPINNNQWAVKSLVLDRATNGYVEAA